MATGIEIITLWISVALWFLIASWCYKDNPLFRIGAVMSVAGGAANALLVNFDNIRYKAIEPILTGNVTLIIPLILGILLFATFHRGYSWTARYPTILMIGVSMGAMITGVPKAQIVGQIQSAAAPLMTVRGGWGLFNALLGIVGVIAAITYFTYGREHTGNYGWLTKLGRQFLMASLGPYWAGELGFHITFAIKFVQIIVQAIKTIIPF